MIKHQTTEEVSKEIRDFARLKSTPIYTVMEGMEGGYTPNSVSYHATKGSARESMIWSASNARSDGYIVKGSARNGLYTLTQPGRSKHALCEYIELGESTIGNVYPGIDRLMSVEEIIDQLNS